MKTFLTVLATCAMAVAGDWPRFRGPNGSGISDATAIPTSWTESDYAWKAKLPAAGHSSPVIVGNRLFVTCADKDGGRQIVLGLDAATGKILWQREFPFKPYRQNKDNSFASATPAADSAGVVVTWSTPQQVVLLALDNAGREVWRRDFGPFIAAHGNGSSPIIAGGLVIFDNNQEDPAANPASYKQPDSPKEAGSSFVVAVDRKTGKTRWQLDRTTGLAAYATPCVRDNREVIVCNTKHGITGIDLFTGKVNWEIPVFDRRVVSSPVLHGELVLNGCGSGGAGSGYFAVKAKKAELVYTIEKPVPYVPTALVKDDFLFLWGDNGTVTCADARSGKVIWRERIQGAFYSSPVCAGGCLYNITRSGDVIVIAAADKFQLMARIPLGEPSHASAAIAGGTLYLRTLTQVFAVRRKYRAHRLAKGLLYGTT
ncbi:MAG: PQQ-like beta-propeller repeat protein [Verrucomicrobiae bacterium]|nr:PQQ-like beta-propeller repeat protein [Verrucomicrobiae bacterium]